MSPKLRRWTGIVAAATALILVTAAFTTLVNQTFFAATEPAAIAPSQSESNPGSGRAEIDTGVAAILPEPAVTASADPRSGAADAVAEPGEPGIDSGAADAAESDAVKSGPESGEAALAASSADAAHAHSSHSESPEAAPKLCVIADGDPDKLHWRFVEFHAGRAAEIVGMQLEYSTHPDAAARAHAIEACARDGAPMILATLADPQVIVPAMRAAADQGVRIASFGAGAEHADSAGSLIHVAMDGSAAVRRAADQFAAAGISGAVLCLIPDGVEATRRHLCEELRTVYAGGSVIAHRLAAIDPGGQIEDLLAAAPETAGLLVLEADLLPHAIEAMEISGIAPVLGSIGEYPLHKLPFAQRDQIAFTVMELARFEVLLAAAALRLMHTYHPNARFFEGAMIFDAQPNVHTGGARGGHERTPGGGDAGHGDDGHGHGDDGENHH